MNSIRLKMAASLFITAVFSVVIFVRWSLIADFCSSHVSVVVSASAAVKILTSLLASSLFVAYLAWRAKAVTVVSAVAAAIALFVLLQYTAAALVQVWYPAIFIILIVAAPTIAVSLIRGRRTLASLSTMLTLNLIPHLVLLFTTYQDNRLDTSPVSILLGDAVAAAAARFEFLPQISYWLFLVLSFCALGTTIAAVYTLVSRRNVFSDTTAGSLWGLLSGLWVGLSQLILYASILISGYNYALVLAVFLLVQCAMTAVAWFALTAIKNSGKYLLPKLSPLIFAALLSVFLVVVFYGSRDYRCLDLYHSDSNWAYIHYDSAGGWRRTLDHSTSSIRLWRAQRFIETYPYSVYKPAAMLRLAGYYFDAWQFDDASDTLVKLQRSYPYMRGQAQIVLSMMDLARGNTTSILKPGRGNSTFDLWRRSQGAQLAAFAALRSSQPSNALGYFSFYTEYLQRRQPAAWIEPSLAYAGLHADEVISKQREGVDRTAFSQVIVRVQAGQKPVRGARVVLVQPHFDAALPTDSRQFAGAWSIVAWNGCHGVTRDDGAAIIAEIPCGQYEVVLGIDHRTCPPGFVVSQPIKPISVCAGKVAEIDVSLVPGVRLLSPRNGDLLTNKSSLRWQPYPGAATYSVSILKIARSKELNPGVSLASSQKTCWARSGVRECETPIDPRYFLGNAKALESGHLYMCVVYAYGEDGSMLSSSEHYFDMRETVFSVH